MQRTVRQQNAQQAYSGTPHGNLHGNLGVSQNAGSFFQPHSYPQQQPLRPEPTHVVQVSRLHSEKAESVADRVNKSSVLVTVKESDELTFEA